MPTRAPITLKNEITALRQSGNVGRLALVLDDKDVAFLLRKVIEREGSISAFARRHGIERSYLTNVLNGKRPASSSLLKTLGLTKVCAPK